MTGPSGGGNHFRGCARLGTKRNRAARRTFSPDFHFSFKDALDAARGSCVLSAGLLRFAPGLEAAAPPAGRPNQGRFGNIMSSPTHGWGPHSLIRRVLR